MSLKDGRKTRTPLSRLPESGLSNTPRHDRRPIGLASVSVFLDKERCMGLSQHHLAFMSMGGVGQAFFLLHQIHSVSFKKKHPWCPQKSFLLNPQHKARVPMLLIIVQYRGADVDIQMSPGAGLKTDCSCISVTAGRLVPWYSRLV